MPRHGAPVFTLIAFDRLSASPATALLRVIGRTTVFSASAVLVGARRGQEQRFQPLPGRPRPGRWAYSAPLALVDDPDTAWSLEIENDVFSLPEPETGMQVERRRGHERRDDDRREEDELDEFALAGATAAAAEMRVGELEDELARARETIGALERQGRRDAQEIEGLLRQIRGDSLPAALRPREAASGSD